MPEPEGSMRRACDAIVQGDILTAMNDLSSEAYADAMNLASGLTTVPTVEGYEIEASKVSDGAHVYHLRFKTNLRDLRATATWRQTDAGWKISAITVEPDA